MKFRIDPRDLNYYHEEQQDTWAACLIAQSWKTMAFRFLTKSNLRQRKFLNFNIQ